MPSLSKEQLKEVKGRIAFLLNNTKPESKPLKENGSYLRDVILLYSKKVTTVPEKSVLENSNPFKVNEKIDNISKEVERLAKKLELDRKETMKLCKVLIESADAKIQELGHPMSFRMLLSFMADPKTLLEESFPGYVTTNLFRSIVLK